MCEMTCEIILKVVCSSNSIGHIEIENSDIWHSACVSRFK